MQHKNEELLNSIYQYVESFMLDTHRQPSITEVADHFGIGRTTAFRYINELKERDLLTGSGSSYTTKKASDANTTHTLNIYPSVACGLPQLEEAPVEGYLTISSSIIGSGEFFAVRANGDSMIDAGIDDGDLVIAQVRDHANYGDLVIALTDGSSNTLKRYDFDKKKGVPYLKPENKNHGPIYSDDIAIQGVVIYILKQAR